MERGRRRRGGEHDPFEDNIRYILGKVSEMAQLLRDRGVDFYVGIFPDEYQISPTLRERVYKDRGTKESDYDLLRAQKVLRAHLEAEEVGYLDFLPILDAAHRVRRAFHERDSHFNFWGNRAVGTAYFLTKVEKYLEAKVK